MPHKIQYPEMMEVPFSTPPEKNLWSEVLKFGLISAARGDRKDLRWLFSDSTKPCSYLWILSVLKLENYKNKLRSEILNNKKKFKPRAIVARVRL